MSNLTEHLSPFETDFLPPLKKEPKNTAKYPVLFFDIDGTLLYTHGGRRAISRAFAELFGVEEAFSDVSFAGQTDPLIVGRVFTENSIEHSEENSNHLYDLYYRYLAQEIQADIRPFSGIPSLLAKLQEMPLHLGIITGNNFTGARIKLAATDLHHFFEGGAYAEDGPQRTKIAKAGLEKFGVRAEEALMIGDSIHDIRVGRENGMLTLGLPTGVTPVEDLKDENPDYLFEKLNEDNLLMVLEKHNFLT
jgi:phosphoglycolate phosphatase